MLNYILKYTIYIVKQLPFGNKMVSSNFQAGVEKLHQGLKVVKNNLYDIIVT